MDATNDLVYNLLGSSLLEIDRAYWAVKLVTGEWVCEARFHADLLAGTVWPFDWSNDLVATGDVKRIIELWLLCPPTPTSPSGNTARLPITEAGTAFQFKIAHASSNLAATWRQPDSQIIGRVTDKQTGACECFIWDYQYQCLIAPPWKTNIYDFGTWKTSLPARRTGSSNHGNRFVMTWYDTNYLHKKQITLNTASGGSNLSNFPVLINRTDTDLKVVGSGGSVQNSSGFDLIFTDGTESTKLDHEIESYTGSSGAIVMWVRIPTLSSSVTTTIYMYYDNSTISTSQENKTGVWDTNFAGVWHLKENPAGTAPQMKDSTSNANHGTATNTWTSGQQVSGQIDGALNFLSANSDEVDVTSASNLMPTGDMTVSFWMNATTTATSAGHDVMFFRKTHSISPFSSYQIFWQTANNKFDFNWINSTSGSFDTTSNTALTTSTWYHLAFVKSGTSGIIYLNGTSDTASSFTTSGTLFQSNSNLLIGGASGKDFNGIQDEVHLSSSARSAGWIATEYSNQHAPTSFISVGPALSQNVTVFKDIKFRGRVSGQANKDVVFRARTSGTARHDIVFRANVSLPEILSGGFTLFANGTGTASFDSFRVTQYPDPSVTLLNAGRASSSITNFTGNFPTNTALVAQSSTDNGVTWQTIAAAGNPIPGISTLLYSTLILQRKPGGYYHLSESSGTTANDSSGNGYNGTLHGGVTLGASGALQGPGELSNTSMTFDGSTGYIGLASGLKTDGWSNLTLAVWFNTSASVGSATYVLANDNPASTHNGVALGLNALLAGCFATIGNGTTSATATFSTTLLTNAWYYLVATWDATTIRIYLNGVQQATASLSGSVGTAAQALAIGYNPATAGGYFKGSLDEISLVNPTTANAIPPVLAADVFAQYNAGLAGVGTTVSDVFSPNSSANYTQTNGSGGSGATWTWDTANNRLIASGGSKAVLLYNGFWAYDLSIYADFWQAQNGGVVWGWQNNQNYYELVVKDSGAASGANTVTLNKISAGAATQLSSGPIFFPTQSYHRIYVTMLAGVIVVSLDEKQILSYTDSSPFAAGLSGVRNDTGTSYCTWFRITPQPVSVSNQYLVTQQILTTTDPTVTPQITSNVAAAFGGFIDQGVIIPQADYRDTFIGANIDDLAKQSNRSWFTASTAQVVFNLTSGRPAPWIVQSSNGTTPYASDIEMDSNLSVTVSGDLYRNRQVITNAAQTNTYLQSFLGDGFKRQFTLGYKVLAGTVPTITVDGLGQTVGQKGTTGFQWYYTEGDQTIEQDTSQRILLSSDLLVVSYTGYFTTTVQEDNVSAQQLLAAQEGGTGIIEQITDGKNMVYSAAVTLAQQLLAFYSVSGRSLSFKTYRNGLAVGQQLTVYLPEENLNNVRMYITEVDLTMQTQPGNTTLYGYVVTATELPNTGSWQKLLASGLVNPDSLSQYTT